MGGAGRVRKGAALPSPEPRSIEATRRSRLVPAGPGPGLPGRPECSCAAPARPVHGDALHPFEAPPATPAGIIKSRAEPSRAECHDYASRPPERILPALDLSFARPARWAAALQPSRAFGQPSGAAHQPVDRRGRNPFRKPPPESGDDGRVVAEDGHLASMTAGDPQCRRGAAAGGVT